jgi:hypothetical protein
MKRRKGMKRIVTTIAVALLFVTGAVLLTTVVADARTTGVSVRANRLVTLMPGQQVLIAGYQVWCSSIENGREGTMASCQPVDATGSLAYFASGGMLFDRTQFSLGSQYAARLVGYTRSPRSYTYAFSFGRRDHSRPTTFAAVVRPGDTLRIAGTRWLCASTARTPNFSCFRQDSAGRTLSPILRVGDRSFIVETVAPAVLMSLIGDTYSYHFR